MAALRDEDDPVDMIALHRLAREAQSEMTALAQLYILALKAREYPSAITEREVERLAEGVLKHVKPYIRKRESSPP